MSKIKKTNNNTNRFSTEYLIQSSSKPSSGKRVDLTTQFSRLTLQNPITVASGTFGTKGEYSPYIDLNKLGAIITKTITVKPRQGNLMPRICETTGGMLNAIGLQNKGLDDFVQDKIPYYRKVKTPLIVNIAGETVKDFETLTSELNRHKDVVKGIEVNLSCPNVEAGGVNANKKRKRIREIIKKICAITKLPVIAKLSPELGDVLEIADDVMNEGAHGLSLINTLKGMAVNVETGHSRIANITGGLSGSAIKPVALRYVYEVKKNLNVPVIASGGITNALDAIEFLIVGADLLAIGTANFINPTATMDILSGIQEYCRRHKITHIKELRGSFKGSPVKGVR